MILDPTKEPVFNAEILKELRIKKGLSCAKLAEDSGVEKQIVYRMEKKGIQRPSFETVAKLARTLEVSTDIFIREMSL